MNILLMSGPTGWVRRSLYRIGWVMGIKCEYSAHVWPYRLGKERIIYCRIGWVMGITIKCEYSAHVWSYTG